MVSLIFSSLQKGLDKNEKKTGFSQKLFNIMYHMSGRLEVPLLLV